MFHAEFLSSSNLDFLKEDCSYKKNQQPSWVGPILTQGLFFEHTF
jgi:hypothetical protein